MLGEFRGRIDVQCQLLAQVPSLEVEQVGRVYGEACETCLHLEVDELLGLDDVLWSALLHRDVVGVQRPHVELYLPCSLPYLAGIVNRLHAGVPAVLVAL